MEPRFGRLTGPGVAVLAASAFALLLAGLILLVKFAASDATQARQTAIAPALEQRGGMPRPPAWDAPSASKEGESWSHKELFAYLNSRGMRWSFARTAYGTQHGPAVFCKENVSSDDQYQLDNDQSEAMRFTGEFTYSQKRPNAGEAKDEAGSRRNAFSWGRFLFVGPETSLDRLRSALRVPGG